MARLHLRESITIMTASEEASTSGRQAPRSWAEDLNSYRSTRGSQSYKTVLDTGTGTGPKRFGRTALVPFADERHPLYPYNDFPNQDGGDRTRQDSQIQSERYSRHGWGDTSLLKVDGYAGVAHPRGELTPEGGKARTQSPRGKDGRNGLFGVLQQTEAGGADSWIGNGLIDPTKGKRPAAPSFDPKGRKDLFDVLHGRNPGVPADDSWLGHKLIDPAKGKGRVPGPEVRRGRTDLTDTFTQSILREPEEKLAQLMKKGGDPLADAWCGHINIDPSKGKAPVQGMVAAQEVMLGATFKPPVPENFTDFRKPHTRQVPAPQPDMARAVMTGTAPADIDKPTGGKKPLPEARGSPTVPRSDHLYGHLTFRPLNEVESTAYSKAFSDGRSHARRHVSELPGSGEHGKGSDLLAWHPEQAVGRFVPFGGLAQEGRKTKQGIPQGTMGRPMPMSRVVSMDSSTRF